MGGKSRKSGAVSKKLIQTLTAKQCKKDNSCGQNKGKKGFDFKIPRNDEEAQHNS